VRPMTLVAATYVATVAVLATWGFGAESTALILLAFTLALPTGAVALVGYYVAYGLLSLLPGHGAWFSVPTTALGILAPVAASLLNVFCTRQLLRRRRRQPVDDDSRPGVPAC
jgi:hypothetical protein